MTDNIQTQCAALESAGLKSRILYPGTTSYAAREASYWSASAPLAPLCIVQPGHVILPKLQLSLKHLDAPMEISLFAVEVTVIGLVLVIFIMV